MTEIIYLKYLKDLISEEELESLKFQLGEHGIGFEWHGETGKPKASLQELLAPIILYLSSDVVQAYILGLATNASYDIIKSTVLHLWQNISGKKIKKITVTDIEELNANFDLCVNISGKTSIRFKLEGNIPDSLKEKCIDKAFQLLASKKIPEIHTEYVCCYNVDSEKWEIFEMPEFIRKYITPKYG